MFLSSHGSRIRILIFYPSRIPDPEVRKALDPGSRSVTLQKRSEKEKNTGDFRTRKTPEERDVQKEELDEEPKRDGHSVGQKKLKEE